MTQSFYKPKPIAPTDNPQMKALRWSLRVSVAGWIIYGAFAYAFADLSVIPATLQSWAAIIGSILIVAGAESNTIATTETALSKLGTERISKWDLAAVIASLVGGICTPLITFSTRQPDLANWWRRLAINGGPLMLGIAGVFDFYGAVTELALSKRDYVRELGKWLEEQADWNQEHGIAPQVDRSGWKPANVSDFRRLLAGLNGDRPNLTKDNLQEYFDKEHKVVPSQTTVDRWWREELEVH